MIKIFMAVLLLVTFNANAGIKVDRYKSFDGREFETERECKEYEETEKKVIEISKIINYDESKDYSTNYHTLGSALREIVERLREKNKRLVIMERSKK